MDDRAWGFVIQNDGEIMWCDDNEFSDQEGKQHSGKLLLKAVSEESDYREQVLDRLQLEGKYDGGEGGRFVGEGDRKLTE